MYSNGDFIKINAMNGTEQEVWYGEVVGCYTDSLEVFLIEKHDTENTWSYSEEWHKIPVQSVMEHIYTTSNGVVAALKQLGFRPLDESTFVKLDEENDNSITPIGMDLPVEEDCIGIHPEMADFIVDDNDGEAFHFADPTNDFVRETHQAVHDFNNWQPDENGQKIKDFIDTMDTRECVNESGRSTLGNAVSYTQPPL